MAQAVAAGLPRGRVAIHHSTLIEQLPGSNSALVSVQGIVEYPARRHFEVRWPLTDAMLEPSSPASGAVHTMDAGGIPVLSGVRGLGTRQAFSGEGISHDPVLSVVGSGRTFTVSNRSAVDLVDCRFAAGFDPATVARLGPGATATATQNGDSPGPLVTCVADGVLLPFDDRGAPLATIGETVVAVYR
jgi:hypothetical protein